MKIFRWIMGVLSVLLASGAAISFVIFILRDQEQWIALARRFRRWTTTALLFWFNIEVWGRVIWTLIHW
jgi:transposase